MPSSFNCFILSAVVCLFAGHVVGEAPLVTRPLPMKLEAETVPSCFCITVRETEYNKSLSDVANGAAAGSVEDVLRRLVNAITSNDQAAYKANAVSQGDEDAADRFAMYRTIFEGARGVVVVRRFDLGGAAYVVLDVGKREFPIVPFLLKRVDRRYVNSFEDMAMPVVQCVSSLARAIQADPKRFAPVATPKESISLMPLFGENAVNAVTLSFAAYRVDYLAFDGGNPKATTRPDTKVAAVDAILQTYARSFKLFYDGKVDAYLETIGPVSRTRLKVLLQDPQKRKQYAAAMSGLCRVRLVIIAENVFVLVYQTLPGPYEGDVMLYHTLYRSPEGSILQGNVGLASPLDLLLRSPQVSSEFIGKIINDKPAASSTTRPK